jgi:hypothetical protein
VKKENHAGVIVASGDLGRVDALIGNYAGRFAQDFMAFAPAPDRAPA